MDAATENRSEPALLPALLAGLEAGMVGALWMLAWLGTSSVWQQRSFWTPENLMSTAFNRDASLAPGFTASTWTGLALYLLIYSLLGAVFAVAVRGRVPRTRVMLLAVVFGLAWYYISFQGMFKVAMPLVALLHVERSTVLGHLVYGTMLGRFPLYVERLMGTRHEPAAVVVDPGPPGIEAPAVEESPGEPVEKTKEGPASEP